MSKEELLSSIEGGDRTSFLALLKQHGTKRNPFDLGEVLVELNRGQLESIWKDLHAWATEELAKLIVEPSLSQEEQQQKDVVQGPSKGQVDQIQGPPQGQVDQIQGPPQGQDDQVQEPLQAQDDQVQMQVVESHPGDAENAEVEPATEGGDGAEIDKDEPYSEKLMQGILEFAVVYISSVKGPGEFIPEKLLELAVLMHGMVTILEGKVQERVLDMCETWWLHELEDREHLVGNILPIRIEMAMSKSGLKKNVISLYNIRGALQVVNFDEPLMALLVASAACPRFVSCEEGVKWISELFSWETLVLHLHRSIKSVLPECTRDHSAKYAEVYFRAWKKSTGDVKQIIEESCLQDLMYAAVHVDPLTGRLSANLHHLLHHIHRHKRHHVVEKTILSLYDPFLWRSLKAANGYVRMNAAGLLCDAFPLSDSSCTLEEREDLLEKQYQTIIMLLTDPCHLVRITAIKGTCSILNNYWLMIPSQVIKTIFQTLLSDLLCDASSAEVRTQVVKGLTLLLDNNDAVPFLKEVLPRISDSFDDISVSVRIAFVHLLLKVKALKVIRYWTIVPIKHMLHRLEDDMPAVCKLLTQLLLSSFHPTQRKDQELLQRCFTLLEENRGAARRFYQYASRTLDLPSTVHFMLLIWHCLRNFIISQQMQDTTAAEGLSDCGDSTTESQPASSRQDALKGSTSNRNPKGLSGRTENKENRDSGNKNGDDDDDNDESPLDNPMVIGGLLDTIVILWSTNAHRLAQPQNLKYLEAIRLRISKSMPLFFKFFKENKDVSQTLLYLSSFLPKSLVPTLVGHCLSQLRSLQQDENHGDMYVTYINALCNWNRVDDVLELATDWLTEGFSTTVVSNAKERRLSGRGVRFHETYAPQPLLALRLIRHILQHPLNKLAALSKNRSLVLELAETLKMCKDLLGERLNHSEELSALCTDRFLSEAWAQYMSLVAVLHNPAKEPVNTAETEDEGDEVNTTFDSCEQLHDCLDWANRVLVPVLSSEEVGEKRKYRAGDDAFKMSTDALNHLVKTCNNMIIIGAADSNFVYRLCSFTDALLKSEMCETIWESSLMVALEGFQYLQVYGSHNTIGGEGIVTPVDLVNSCITSMAEGLREDKALLKETNIENTLSMVLTTLGQTRRETQNEIFQHMAATIVDHLCIGVEKDQGVDRDIKALKQMGSCPSLLIGVCQTRVRLSSGLMEALASFVTDSVMDATALLAISHLLQVLSQDSGKISRYSLKQAVVAVDSLLARVIFPVGLDDTRESTDAPLTSYEEYAKTSREIVGELKSSLGVI